MDGVLVNTMAEGLQAAFEAINALSAELPERRQQDISKTAASIQRARMALHEWVEENR